MKISKDLKSITTTQTEMARTLGLTQQRVSQMLQEEIMVNNSNGDLLVIESLKNFYKSQNQKLTSGDAVDYWEEKAKHEKAKREMAELQLAKAQGNVYDARTVELVIIEEYSRLRTQLLGLPSKLAPMLENKSRSEIYDILTREIEEKLNELSEYEDLKPSFAEEAIEDGESE